MTTLACVNLNKRMTNEHARGRLGRWLAQKRVQVLMAQEPLRGVKKPNNNLIDWNPIGGNEKVFAWINSQLEHPKQDSIGEFWQRIELGYFAVYNVYLDAYSQSARATQLQRLIKPLTNESDRPLLIVGDFNIAPAPEDGRSGGVISTFNSEVDREPLRHLLKLARLADLRDSSESRQWTIERDLPQGLVQFRCDLALASDYISHELSIRYDHSTRSGPGSFTDHSALLVELPVSLHEAEQQTQLFPLESFGIAPSGAWRFKPEHTAMHRKEPTPIARRLAEIAEKDPSIKSILDYGCGYGEDVRFYTKRGLHAEGYDPHSPFGWSAKPSGKFDLVTVVFVLNVLPDPWARLKVVREAANYLSQTGRMVIVTRSESEIEREAEMKGWIPFNDGYWSSEERGTFQRGITRNDILAVASRVGLGPSPLGERLSSPPGSTCVVLESSTRGPIAAPGNPTTKGSPMFRGGLQ
jgi:Methyltransferase domain/Endonuclease/Exonuclease/phosphatase family